MRPSEIFRRVYQGKRNFLTPRILGYGRIAPGYVYELSEGRGITPGTTLVGVTVVRYEGDHAEPAHELSRAFASRADARRYIRELRKQLRKQLT